VLSPSRPLRPETLIRKGDQAYGLCLLKAKPGVFEARKSPLNWRAPIAICQDKPGMSNSTSDVLRQFHNALEGRGILVEGGPVADGQIHRAPTAAKPRKKDAAYCLHLDGSIPAGWFQNWRDGVGPETWRADIGRRYSEAEESEYRKLIARQRNEREAEADKRYAEARKRASAIWNAIASATDHPYLVRKGIEPHGVRIKSDKLIIPARDTAGTLHTFQYIDAEGRKRFLKGGAVAGHYFDIGGLTEGAPLCICEGFATGASIHQATGYPVAVAFDCGNLEAVARSLKDKHPELPFIVCADNDTETDGNPGLTKARTAALAIDAELCFPNGVVDFNDLHAEAGLDAVRDVIQAAEPQPPQDQLDSYTVRGPGVDYSVSGKGVFCKGDDGDTFICSRLDVVAQARDIESASWGRLVRFPDPDGVLHEWCLPMSMLATDGADMRRELMHQGLRIGAGNTARRRLTDYIQHATPERRARAVIKTGWESGGGYVLPGEVISPEGRDELVYLQTVNAAAARWYTEAGSLAAWQAHVASQACGNSRLILSISAALAAPLLGTMHGESGGLHLHGESSQGKTTALIVAVSVWGNPAERIQSWRATSNGLEGIAAGHNDSLLTLDEISQCDEREIGHTAYMLANGRGKTRSNRDATLRQSHTWRLLFISTGEQSMSEYLKQAGLKVNAGHTVRFVDLPAVPDGSSFGVFEHVHDCEGDTRELQGQKFADALVAAAKRQYGAAGRAFLDAWIQGDHATELTALRLDFKTMHTPAGASPQVLRVLDRFALIAGAGELATQLGITGWQSGEAFEGVGRCVADWLTARGGVAGMEDQQIIETLAAFLESDAARFEPWDKCQYDRTPYKRAGYYRESDQTWFIFSGVFRKEICRGMDSTRAARILHERGYLVEKSRKQYSVNKRKARVYVIRLPEIAQPAQEAVSVVSPVSGNDDGPSGNTARQNRSSISSMNSASRGGLDTTDTVQKTGAVSAKPTNGAVNTADTVGTAQNAEPAFSELSIDNLELINLAVDLINSELGEGSYSPESFFAAIPEADRGNINNKLIGATQLRIRFGPGVDG
jgi:putative DNA primase/helicase